MGGPGGASWLLVLYLWSTYLAFISFFLNFETGSHQIAQASLELIVELRQVLNLQLSSCICLLGG